MKFLVGVALVAAGCGGRAVIDDGPSGAPSPLASRGIFTFSSIVFNGQQWLIGLDDLEGTGYTTDNVDGALHGACDPVFDAQGRLLFAEGVAEASRLVRYDLETGRVEPFEVGDAPAGLLASIEAVALDAQGRIYGVDSAAHQVFRIDDLDGSGFVALGSGPGSGTFELDTPVDVAVGADGKIVISDPGNARVVQVDDMSGAGWTVYDLDGEPFDPWGVAVDVSGAIYVVDFDAFALYRFDPSNEARDRVGLPGQPQHAALGADGRIYVSFLNGSHALGVMDGFAAATLTTYTGPDDEPFINPCGIAVR
ncbi:MAG: hypothetical protein KC731_37540 [Myxococcales bacterium]|nr:hypothetical protein [Myxococcales bacterium]